MTGPAIQALSSRNTLVKDARKAVERGGLTPGGLCVAESFHLLEEALRSGRRISAVLCEERAAPEVERRFGGRGLPMFLLDGRAFSQIASTGASQGVIALVEPPQWEMGDLLRGTAQVAVLDGIQDPGNAGTVVRSAEAFGASGVVFLKGTAHPWNPKTLRASAGSLFRVPFVAGVEAEALAAESQRRGIRILAADARLGSPAERVDLTGSFFLAVGNEAHGVRPALAAAAEPVRIPTAGVESLNAAIAASVLLYEARRQRNSRELG